METFYSFKHDFIFILYLIWTLPESWRIMNLITKDEGCPRSVRNVLGDPVHLGHHLVHLTKIPTLWWDFGYWQCVNKHFITCYDHYWTRTWNIHTKSPRNKFEGITWVFVIHAWHYLRYKGPFVKPKSNFLSNLWPGQLFFKSIVKDKACIHITLTWHSVFNKSNFFLYW